MTCITTCECSSFQRIRPELLGRQMLYTVTRVFPHSAKTRTARPDQVPLVQFCRAIWRSYARISGHCKVGHYKRLGQKQGVCSSVMKAKFQNITAHSHHTKKTIAAQIPASGKLQPATSGRNGLTQRPTALHLMQTSTLLLINSHWQTHHEVEVAAGCVTPRHHAPQAVPMLRLLPQET